MRDNAVAENVRITKTSLLPGLRRVSLMMERFHTWEKLNAVSIDSKLE
jgi:hypothetical protein